jgi:HEAT repeat protein
MSGEVVGTGRGRAVKSLRTDSAGLADMLRSLDLEEVAISATLDAAGNLGSVGGLADKIEAAVERQQRRGLLHGVMMAQTQVVTTKTALTILQATSFAEALARLSDESLPQRLMAAQVPANFRLFGVDRDLPFDSPHYQPLPLLRKIDKERLPRGSKPGGENWGILRLEQIERWEEQVLGETAEYREVPLEQAFQELARDMHGVPRLVVIGPPGSGKSTLVDLIAYRCLRVQLFRRRLLPVRVSLRQWQEWGDNTGQYDLPAYFAHAYDFQHAPTVQQWRQWLRLGGLLLLLDGLDEIDNSKGFVVHGLNQLLHHPDYTRCPLVLTCRTISFEQYRDLGQDLQVFRLAGLKAKQQATFIKSYPARHRAFEPERLVGEVKRLPEMRALAANPLLLSIICHMVDDPDRVTLPVTRSQLYSLAVRKLLKRGEGVSGRHSPRVPVVYPKGIRLSLEGKETYLEELALALWLGPGEERQLIFESRTVRQALIQILQDRYPRPDAVADNLLEDLVHNSGLLRRVDDERYVFLHLTFQEYLVAAALARRANEESWEKAEVKLPDGRRISVAGLVEERAWDRSWQEVVRLLAGQMSEPSALLEMLTGVDVEGTPGNWHLLLAGRCLGEILDKRAPAMLAEHIMRDLQHALLYSASARDRDRAAGALAGLPYPQAFDALLEALRDADEVVRRAVVGSLGQVSSERAVQALSEILRGDRDDDDNNDNRYVRQAAAESLGQIGGEWAIEALLGALWDPYSCVRRAAVQALGQVGGEPVVGALSEELWDAAEDVRGAAAHALGQIGSARALEVLAEALRNHSLDTGHVRWEASNHIRRVAAEVLAKVGSERGLEALLEALRDPWPSVRWEAARALRWVGAESAVEALAKALRDPDEQVRRAAVRALGAVGGGRALEAISKALHDTDRCVRRAAARALAKVGVERGFEALSEAWRDPHVRQVAGRAFGQVPSGEQILQALSEALRDLDARQVAAGVLTKCDGKQALEGLSKILWHPNRYVRRAALRALARFVAARSVAALSRVLRHPNKYVRREACRALGRVGGEQSVEALLAALRDPDRDVRQVAAQALGEIGDRRAVELLLAALGDPEWDVRWAAAQALGVLGRGEALPAILHYLADNWPHIAASVDSTVEVYDLVADLLPLAVSLPEWPAWRAAFLPLSNLVLASR